MNLTGKLSIRSQLIILLLLTSIISIIVVAYQGYSSGKSALEQATLNQLTTLREAKKQQIQAYFSDIHNQVLAFSENRTVIEALNEFRTAFQLAGTETLTGRAQEKLENYYRDELIPRLKERIGGEPEIKHYLPTSRAASYLQYHYIATNPSPVGRKDELASAPRDNGYYAQVHERYHDSLRSLSRKFGYHDLFLIDHESGDVVYSVFKETDYATNLTNGPYASSNFAHLIKDMIRTKERGRVRFQDYDVYLPSYGSPAAFVAITIYDGQNIAGILALQIPSDQLNNVMTSNKNWEASGMGKTGEVFLVGRDNLMRSDSRFLIQDSEQFFSQLRNIGMPEDEISHINKLQTTILFQPVYAETVQQALNGKTGTGKIVDYRGVPVMSAYAPLRVHGLDWVIMSEMDQAEINIPIDHFRRQVMVSASILGVAITLLALYAASLFTRPIHILIAALRRVGKGETGVVIEVNKKDELGELAHTFNTLVKGIDQYKQEIQEKEAENNLLLHNILPEAIAHRMKTGEEEIVDRIPNVSIIFTSLTGLNQADDEQHPQAAIQKLNALISAFDKAAEKHGIDKIKTIGDDYMAACGLTTPRLDHAKRALNFAREITGIANQLGAKNHLQLELRIGIHSGSVLAGVIGYTKITYDVWGDTVDVANAIRFKATAGSLCITQATHELIQEDAEFIPGEPAQIDGTESTNIWHLNIVDITPDQTHV